MRGEIERSGIASSQSVAARPIPSAALAQQGEQRSVKLTRAAVAGESMGKMLCGWSLLHVARPSLAPRNLASVLLVRGSIERLEVRFAPALALAATPAAENVAARETAALHSRTLSNATQSSALLLRQS